MRRLFVAWPLVAALSSACTLLNQPQAAAGDLCAPSAQRCDPKASCAVNAGAVKCSCPKGYRDVHGNGTLCRDRDECADGSNQCLAPASCQNQPGGYDCICPPGYARNKDGHSCTAPDPCMTASNTCNVDTQKCQPLSDNAQFMCVCRDGFEAHDDGTCSDIDECANDGGGCQGPLICVNEPGTFSCRCPKGIDPQTGGCASDACAASGNRCTEHASCMVDSGTSIRCECDAGYQRRSNGAHCQNIDECANTPCRDGAHCNDTPGSFSCDCPNYYAKSADGLGCVDERLQWAATLGGTNIDCAQRYLKSYRAQPVPGNDGELFVAGTFVGTIELCGATYVSVGAADFYIVKYDAARACQWVRTFGYVGCDELIGATLDHAGNLVLTARYAGTIDLGGVSVDSGGYEARLVAKLDAHDGNAIWAKSFFNVDWPDSTAPSPDGPLITDADDNVLLGGRLAQGAMLESQTPPASQPAALNALVAKLAAQDGHVMAWQTYEGGASWIASLAAEDDGTVVIGGPYYLFDIDVDGTKLTASAGISKGFVAKLTPDLRAIWVQSIDKALNDASGYAGDVRMPIATVSTGDVIVGTSFHEFDTNMKLTAQGQDLYVVALAAEDGHRLWERTIGGSGNEVIGQIAVDAHDRIVMAGLFAGSIDLGEGPLLSADPTHTGLDLLVVSLDFTASGSLRWAQGFGGPTDEQNPALSLGADGEVFASASYQPPLTLAGKALTASGAMPAFLVELKP